MEFDQTEFYSSPIESISMDASGYVYVPSSCANGASKYFKF